MSTYTRYWKISIEHDTNKSTSNEEYDNVFDAAKSLLEKLSDDERLMLFSDYCKHCGSEDPHCQCWNDE
jgi:predicted Zn-ribbon and HTH transcriptional regulator